MFVLENVATIANSLQFALANQIVGNFQPSGYPITISSNSIIGNQYICIYIPLLLLHSQLSMTPT